MTVKRDLLLLPLAAALALCACDDYTRKGENYPVVQSVQGLTLIETSSGTVLWTLTASTADIYDNGTRIKLSSPTLVMQENGQETSSVSSREGEMEVEEKNITLRGMVKGRSKKENTSLETELLHYSRMQEKIWTEEEVTVMQNDVTVLGKGMEAKPDLSEVTIRQQQTLVPKEIKKTARK